MVNLTSIRQLVDQTVGTLMVVVEAEELPSGANDVLWRCIATLGSILEDIDDDTAKASTLVTPFNYAEED